MKYYCCLATFKNTWDQVTQAFWQRYPNPYSKHVLSEDVLTRKIQDQKLYTQRILSKTNHMPRWGNYIFGSNSHRVFIVEESVVDLKCRMLTTYTRNIGYKSFMVVNEKCTYRQSEENPGWTELSRQLWIDSSIYGFARAVQKFGIERYKSNSVKSNKGLQHIIDKMFVPEITPGHLKTAQELQEKLKQKANVAKNIAKGKVGSAVQ